MIPPGSPQRRKEEAQKAIAQASQQLKRFGGGAGAGNIQDMLGPVPDLRILERPPGSEVEREKEWLYAQPKEMPHLALVVIHSNAVVPGGSGLEDYGSYDLFVPPKLDDRVDGEIQKGLREAIVHARLKARSLDQATIDAMVTYPPSGLLP